MYAALRMFKDLTTFDCGNQRCTCSPPDPISSMASSMPRSVTRSGLVTSTTILPASEELPAICRADSVPDHLVHKKAVSHHAAASPNVLACTPLAERIHS